MKHKFMPMLFASMLLLALAIVGCSTNNPSNSAPQESSSADAAQASASSSTDAEAAKTDGLASFDVDAMKKQMEDLYGENKKITDDSYDKSLAVKCVNGTFVGKKGDGTIAYKGIPFVGEQPTGEHRWKAPVEYTADDGVYEAYYNGKSPCQAKSPSERASLYPMGEDCLYLNIWKADDTKTEKKPVMVCVSRGRRH